MLAKTHSKQSKLDRKAKKNPPIVGGVPTLTEAYNKADDLVSQVYRSIAKGESRSQIIEKIVSGAYKGMERPLAPRTAANYYNAALDRFAVDTDVEADKLRNMFWGRYESLYEDCVKNNDRYNARGCLDSMAKIFLGLGREKALIEINKDGGDIKISFGFSNDNEADDNNNIVDGELIDENYGGQI